MYKESHLFHEHQLEFLNSFAMASLKLDKSHWNGNFKPTLAVEGQLYLLYGDIVGENPQYIQLYSFDKSNPTDPDYIRLSGLIANSKNVTNEDKETLNRMVRKIRLILEDCNPYAKIFGSVVSDFQNSRKDMDMEKVRLVFTTKGVTEHWKRYTVPHVQNLQAFIVPESIANGFKNNSSTSVFHLKGNNKLQALHSNSEYVFPYLTLFIPI